ncbi:MAG: o-succinylbenzoate synthase [Actinomycetota bacterium]|nr:o-succinylbenzoate synthase [Actinomycetota bacterium]
MALLIEPFSIPMRHRFRRVDVREGVLVQGSAGWGEFSPFPEYGPEVAAAWARSAVESATEPWPEPVRYRIPINVTVPAVDAQTAHDLVTRSSCTTAKVKVAEGDDYARVEAVRAALGPQGNIRIDVNAAWDVDTAKDQIKRLDHFDLEYVEQPVRTLEEMAELRLLVDVPLAADESVRTADDPMRVAGLDAADIVVLKVQPLGGVKRALQVAEAAGLPTVVSSALETSVGIAAGIAMASALPHLPFACGLGTVSLLERDVTATSLLPKDGFIEVGRPEIDGELLEAARPTADDAARIVQRFRVAAETAGIEL